jgi:hypothetical protein
MIELPICRHRSPVLPSGMYHCASTLVPTEGREISGEFCRDICDAKMKCCDHPDLQLPVPRGICRYLGEQTGLRECATCNGKTKYKVFACNHPAHVETTWAECLTCVHHAEGS